MRQPSSTAATTDSREVPGCIFVGVVTATISRPKALEEGAGNAMVFSTTGGKRCPGLGKVFPSARTATARHDDDGLPTAAVSPKVVGVTGSVGKTTKQMTYAAIAGFWQYHQDRGQTRTMSWVCPRTMFHIGKIPRYAVVEMGA